MTQPAPTDRRALVARVLLALVLVGVLVVLLWPSRPAATSQSALQAWFARLHARGLPSWLGFGSIEFSANVVMFLPLGFLTMLAWPRLVPWLPVAGWLSFSTVAEISQAALQPDRVGDWRDVLANTVGAALGVLAARWWLHRRRSGTQVRVQVG